MTIWFDLHSIKNISDIIGYIFTIIRPWDPITATHPSGTRCKKRTLISESAKVVRKTNHIWKICRIIVTRFYSQTCYFTVKTLSNFLRPLFIKFCGLCVIWFPSIQPILFEACLFYFENLFIIWYLIGEINKLLWHKYSLHLFLFLL